MRAAPVVAALLFLTVSPLFGQESQEPAPWDIARLGILVGVGFGVGAAFGAIICAADSLPSTDNCYKKGILIGGGVGSFIGLSYWFIGSLPSSFKNAVGTRAATGAVLGAAAGAGTGWLVAVVADCLAGACAIEGGQGFGLEDLGKAKRIGVLVGGGVGLAIGAIAGANWGTGGGERRANLTVMPLHGRLGIGASVRF